MTLPARHDAKQRHGGEEARRWRRSIAKLAIRPTDERTYTLKFPLDMGDTRLSFDDAAQLYNTVEGINEGSLVAYLLGLHLAGFRVFTSNAAAEVFRTQNPKVAAQFHAAAETHFGVSTDKFTPGAITEFLKAKPRKGLELYGVEDLTARLYFKFSGKRFDARADAGLVEVCHGIAQALCAEFSDWNALFADSARTLGVVDQYLQSVSKDFPSVLPSGTPASIAAPISPIAYEGPPSDLLGQIPSGLWLHATVSRHLPEAIARASTPGRIAAELQDIVLSAQDNALSWLFNKGLAYFQSTPSVTVLSDYGIPVTAEEHVRRVCDLAKKIPAPRFIAVANYANFRRTVSGKLRSWIGNYINRLEELRVAFSGGTTEEIPEEFDQAQTDELFTGLDETVEAWRNAEASLPIHMNAAAQAVKRLWGESGGMRFGDVELVGQLSEALRYRAGFERMLLARIEQRKDDLGSRSYGARLNKWAADRANQLDRIPALPHISGELVDLTREQDRRTQHLNDVLAINARLKDALVKALGGTLSLDVVLAAISRKEASSVAAHPKAVEWLQPERLEELAARRFLSRISGLFRRVTQETREPLLQAIESWDLFARKKILNRWLINRQGSVYQSPWSTARHEALPIRRACWRDATWLHSLIDLAESLSPANGVISANRIRDWLQIEQFVLRTIAESLDGEFSAGLLAGLDLDRLGMSPQLRLALSGETINARDIKRLTGLIQGEVSSVIQDCLRSDVVVRAKFQIIDGEQLVYAPKAKPWTIPDRYLGSGSPTGHALGVLDAKVVELAPELAKKAKAELDSGDARAMGSLLGQIPHDWWMPNLLQPVSFKSGAAQQLEGFLIGKGRTSAGRWGTHSALGRLRGVSSFKTALGRVLLNDDTKFGTLMLIFDQHVQQTISRDSSGRLVVNLQQSLQQLEVAVPLSVKGVEVNPADADRFFGRLIAIDLGERRIGYACFDLKRYIENEVLDPVTVDGVPVNGSVAVPSVRQLIKEVQRYRKKDQPGQKIGNKYSRRLEQYRENVTADVCRAIDTLCAQYGGFPLLESSVRNFEQGSRQLDLVYKAVLNRYSFSNVDAHKSVRKERWFGSDLWKHPYAKAAEWDEARAVYNARKAKDLNLFPGAVIAPAGTSQTCWKCGRNPITVLRGLGSHVQVLDGGVVESGEGRMRLMSGRDYTENERRAARRQKRNLPLNRPVTPGRYLNREAERYLKMTYRQPLENAMARDTTQARYQCVFTDCGSTHHADEGAAINIGRKFLKERIIR